MLRARRLRGRGLVPFHRFHVSFGARHRQAHVEHGPVGPRAVLRAGVVPVDRDLVLVPTRRGKRPSQCVASHYVADRAEHPHGSWPGKGFRCPKCVKCSSCGANHAEAKDHAWAPGYRMCKSCDTLFKSKKYCPVCNVVHGKGENGETFQRRLAPLQAALKERIPNCQCEFTTVRLSEGHRRLV